MSDAPERIWICPEDESWQSGSWDMGPDGQGPEQEYVRADRIEELEAVVGRQHKRAETLAEGWRIADDARIELEAKLAEVVTDLRKLGEAAKANAYGSYHIICHGCSDTHHAVDAIIAKLTGGKDG